ncbi:hypothetical protein [Paenibacillus larvae]|uniref:Uncharacterized protein n=1 Tax=Paenibacillus larvae subsp. larvae TaxID=147375 RepID=A0A6C0QQN6_9BACL|nr:hypothetical protein [Paenibacillus larvae]QHZ50907.1 hypothetical protein ERICV_01752 [Paenibacillus larvae subsp. larvae]
MIILAWILLVLFSLKAIINAAGVICREGVETRLDHAISSIVGGLVVYFMISFLRM